MVITNAIRQHAIMQLGKDTILLQTIYHWKVNLTSNISKSTAASMQQSQLHTWSLRAKISRSNATWPRLDGLLCLSLSRATDHMYITNIIAWNVAICTKWLKTFKNNDI